MHRNGYLAEAAILFASNKYDVKPFPQAYVTSIQKLTVALYKNRAPDRARQFCVFLKKNLLKLVKKLSAWGFGVNQFEKGLGLLRRVIAIAICRW